MGLVRLFLAPAVTVLLSSGGCAPHHVPAPASTALRSTSFEDLPGWSAAHIAAAIPVMLRGCARLVLTPPDQKLGGGPEAVGRGGQAGDWLATCTAARSVPPADELAARAFLQTHFDLIALTDPTRPEGLFTGYYEPEVDGSREENRYYHVPLLTKPDDLVEQTDGVGSRRVGRMQAGSLVPYYSRAEIDHGALRRQRLDLLYLKSAVDLFFLQIQGSGRIDLPNGHVVRVGYAARNGLPYVPIGRTLRDNGQLAADAISAQSIRAWLVAHPGQAMATMESNPAYTFFREMPTLSVDQGPLGTLGVQLTPMQSVAVDAHAIPLGAPVWIDAGDVDGLAVQGLMFAQDTGSGITGSARADIFFGWGDLEENRAGRMETPGRAWLLLPKTPAGS